MSQRALSILVALALILAVGGTAFTVNRMNTMGHQVAVMEMLLKQTYGDLDTVQAAMREGELTWYATSAVQSAEEFAALFMKRYPFLKVKIFHLTGAPMVERFRADVARGQIVADVLDFGGPEMQELIRDNLTVDYQNPGYMANVADELKTMPPKAYPAHWIPGIVAYNTNKVKKEELDTLKTWEDLANPRWKGRLAIVDPNVTTSGFQFMVSFYQAMGPAKYDEWLKGLKANGPKVYNSNTPLVDGVVRGEHDLALTLESTTTRNIEKGAPVAIKYISPVPGTWLASAIPAKAPHPNAAKLFMDFFLSKEGQEDWMAIYGPRAARNDAVDRRVVAKLPNYVPTSKLKLIVFKDWLEPSRLRDQVLKQYNAVFKGP